MKYLELRVGAITGAIGGVAIARNELVEVILVAVALAAIGAAIGYSIGNVRQMVHRSPNRENPIVTTDGLLDDDVLLADRSHSTPDIPKEVCLHFGHLDLFKHN